MNLLVFSFYCLILSVRLMLLSVAIDSSILLLNVLVISTLGTL